MFLLKSSQFPHLVFPLLLASGFAILIVYKLFRLYSHEAATSFRRLRMLEIDAAELDRPGYGQLALVSLLSLFLEMLMIRWVSSEIRVFAYFKNFVLVACFLGFGLGCCLCRRRIHLLVMVLPLMLLAVILKPTMSPLHGVLRALPELLGAGSNVHIWGVAAAPTSWPGLLLALALIVPLFALIALIFVPCGQLVGRYLEAASNGVTAYTVNVLASLAGIAGFTLLCFLYQPPAVWLIVAGILTVSVFWGKPRARRTLALAFLFTIAVVSLPDNWISQTYWSPYQKLSLEPTYSNGEIVSYVLGTNDAWYQQIVNLSAGFAQSHPERFRQLPLEWNAYNLPYRFYPAPASVLVLGSGMGNDVAAALRNGAGRVVAVEIDPLILKLGRQFHFEHPYQSPRTQVVLDDARSYIQNGKEKFDLIIFSLLDSHTTASHFTNIRIDNYVYTREALERAKGSLNPDGLFIVKFEVQTPWIAGRLCNLMKTIFGQEPVQFQSYRGGYDTSGRFFIGGSRQRITKALSDPALSGYVRAHSQMPMETATLTTDNWPYFYQREPGLPVSVILVSIGVLGALGWFLQQTTVRQGQLDYHFFLLGAGFMLLETQIVSRMALLFGTTWTVNSIVVSGLLCLIVSANLLYRYVGTSCVQWAYAGLFVSLLVSFIVPMEQLFYESIFIRAVVSTVVLCSPVFFAGLVFVSSFAKSQFQGSALGSNLFGSLVGGLLESLSLWFGLKPLTILVALLYFGSALALVRRSWPVERKALSTQEQ
jgi:Spermine/spermidine synthase domain